MIADLRFERADAAGVRRTRFVPRASIPLGAACLVANGVRETLRELLGERCEVTLGEPVAIDGDAWARLTADAHCFLTRGRQTDIVLVLDATDARTLVLRAFGEGAPHAATSLSALECHAVERIAARCAGSFDALCAERRGPSQALARDAMPACVAYFDIRVHTPIAITVGLGIVRALPDPGPSGALQPSALARVPLEVRAELATGTIDAQALLALAPGDVVRMNTKVGSSAVLKVGAERYARGACGQYGARHAFFVQDVDALGVWP